ncbi:MAG: PBP1A family penicillin-binding protein [Spirochaetes bacterium]|nr:PBP1A family penicillin-binding protein [Spirochaetota bacterium]
MAKYEGKGTRLSKDGIGNASQAKPPVSEKVKGAIAPAVTLFRRGAATIGGAAMALFGAIRGKIPEKATVKAGAILRSVQVKNAKRYALSAYSITGTLDRAVGAAVDLVRSFVGALRRSPALVAGIAAGVILAFGIILAIDFSRVKSLATFQPSATTKIYDRNGVLVSELFTQKRDVVPLKKIPKDLANAFIAIEDNEYYEHWGVNPKGIVRAFLVNIFSGRIRQGGSTITQQLAKVLMTSQERSYYRKIKEALIAVMMEATYSKDEILSLYLNQIFLGHGSYGVEAAARLYYDKHVWQLNLAECALLASLASAPNQFSPIRHPKRSMQRQKIVLAKMVETGAISVRQAEQAYLDFWPDYLDYLSGLSPSMTAMSSRTNKAPWFTEYVRRELVKRYGAEMVYEKGLQVYTTMDLKKQVAAQETLKKSLDRQSVTSAKLAFRKEDYIVENYSDMIELFSVLFDMPSFKKKGSRQREKINGFIRDEIVEELDALNFLVGMDSVSKFLEKYKETYLEDKNLQRVEGCVISIDHRNGFIEAIVGGSEFTSINQLNRAMQAKRQPGSSIKPLIYAAAIESGEFTPATTVLDSPVVFLDNEGGDWIPENYEGDYSGFVRLRKALALSVNVVSIRISQQLGIEYIMKYLAKLLKFDRTEAKERIQRNFSIALGSMEVSPFELTRAYSIIANGGRDVIPFAIRYVKDREGNILENREEEVQKLLADEEKDGDIQIIKPETAQVLISMMQSVITSGTGGAASPGRPAGGKTGTTNSWKDAWFVGFTPQVTTGVWVGYDKMGLSLGIGQAGGAVAAPIWGDYMREALKDEPVLDFPQFASLQTHEVCDKSGLLPSSDCHDTVEEIFVPGTVPEKTCNVCAGVIGGVRVPKKGPANNISRDQKQTIIQQMEKKKDESIIDHIGDDLLE